MTLRRGLALCLVALLGLTSGCAIVEEAFMISPEQELGLMQQVRAEVEKKYTLVRDPVVVDYVRQVGGRVLAHAPDRSAFPVEFSVVADDSINAFAIPGGRIYVHTGLINAADDEAELASVLAHEYGHVVYRHTARHLARGQAAQIGVGLLLGPESSQVAQLVANLGAYGALQHFGREDELEADSVAVPTLVRAGYDPRAMISFFQTMKSRHGDSGGGLALLLSSHPATEDRIARVAAQADALGVPDAPDIRRRPVTELRQIQARLGQLGLAGSPR